MIDMALSWRLPGGAWKLEENGARETLTLSTCFRAEELRDLKDEDLARIKELCEVALEHRKQHPPKP